LVLVVTNRHLKLIFKNKKIDSDRSLTRCRPRRPVIGVRREGGAAIRVGSGRCHHAQWRRPAAARSRSASARGRSTPLSLEPPSQTSIHAVAIVGGGREEAHTAWPQSAADRPQSTLTDTEERLRLQHGAGGGHHRGHAHERAAVEVGIVEGTGEVILHGNGAEDLRGRERRVEKGAVVELGTTSSPPSSNREREEPLSTKTV
jgi:hypothetical protein